MKRKPARQLLERAARRRATLRTSGARLAQRLSARAGAPPELVRAYDLVLDHLAAELAAVESGVTAAEDAYIAARERAAGCRKERDRSATYLRESYLRIRRVLGRLPIQGAEILAVRADSPEALAHHMPLAIAALRALDREPAPKLIGVTVDAGVLAGDLETALAPLKARLRALYEARTELKIARAGADEALGSAQPVVKWVSQALAGLRDLGSS